MFKIAQIHGQLQVFFIPTMIQENISLKPYNTFGIDVKARYFGDFDSITALQTQLYSAKTKEVLILGGGSNVLFTKDYEGTVLLNRIKGIKKIDEDEKYVWLKVGAGEQWHGFVEYCLEHNYGGIENLSLIPGTVGAAPMQNIGAYGVEVKDTITEVEALEIATQSIKVFDNAACEFRYRESIFKQTLKNQFVITAVTFRLEKHPSTFKIEYGAIHEVLTRKGIYQLSIQAVSQAVCEIRQSKLPDPAKIGNGGSFFKNPTIYTTQFQKLIQTYPDMPSYYLNPMELKLPAAWLIEQAGWKGKSEGQAGVHHQQALVLVNLGNAKGSDILELSKKIQESVFEKYQIRLQTEINIL